MKKNKLVKTGIILIAIQILEIIGSITTNQFSEIFYEEIGVIIGYFILGIIGIILFIIGTLKKD